MAGYKDFLHAILQNGDDKHKAGILNRVGSAIKNNAVAAANGTGAYGKYDDFMAAVGKGIVDTTSNTVRGAIVDPTRELAAEFTGNKQAEANASADSAKHNMEGLGGQVLRNFIVRPSEEILATIRNKPVENNSDFAKAVAGPTQADPIQKKVADTYTSFKAAGGAKSDLAVPAAIGEGLLSVANDIPVVGGGLKVIEKGGKGLLTASKLVKDANPAVKAAEDASTLGRTNVVNDAAANDLKAYANSPAVNIKPSGEIAAHLEKAGISLDKSHPQKLKDDITSYLDKRDTFIDTHNGIAQGGYIKNPLVKTADDTVPADAATPTPVQALDESAAAPVSDAPVTAAPAPKPTSDAPVLPEPPPGSGIVPKDPNAPITEPGVSDNLANADLQAGKPVVATPTKDAITAPNPNAPKGYGEASDELLGRFKYGKDAKDEAAKARGTGIKENLKEQFYDKLDPVNNFVKRIESATGSKLKTEDNPYALMRLAGGLPDAVQQKLNGIVDTLKQAPDINSVKLIGAARQIISRGERGLSSTITPERAQQIITEQRAKLGDAGFQKAADVVDAVQGHNKDILDMLHKEGIVSDQARKAIDEMGGDYFSKMNVLSKVLESDQNRALFASGGSFNTTKQGIKKVLAEASGHQAGETLLDPIESLARGTDAAMHLVSDNQVFKAFQRLQKVAPDLVQTVRDPEDVIQKISLASDNAELRPIRQKLDRLIKGDSKTIRRLETNINQLEKKGLNLSLRNGGERMTNQEFAVDGLGGKVPTSQAGKDIKTTDFTVDANGVATKGSDAERIQNLGKSRDAYAAKAEAARLPEAAPEGSSSLRPVKDFQDALATSKKIAKKGDAKQAQINDMLKDGRSGATGEVVDSKLGPKDTGSFVRNLIENGSRSDIDKIKKMIGTRDVKLNAALDRIGELKSQYDDVVTKVRANSKATKDLADKDVPEGFAAISGYGHGLQGKLAVPKDVADVFTGKTPAQRDYLTSVMSKVNGFVKQNFTSNNPAFALITNPIRDAKSFAYNAKDVKGNPLSIGSALAKGFFARALPASINKNADIVDRWIAAGGKSGFYSDERSGEKIAKDLSLAVNGKRSIKSLGVKVNEVHNAKDFIREATRVATAPLRTARDALHGAASIVEDAPRVAQFQASVKAGKSDAEAALNARNVTVDFQQSGRVGQTINAWVPFLNARGQGTIKSVQAIKANPARAAAVYAALTAAPIALAAANNQRFPDVMKMIPDSDRDNNFVIVLDDHKDAGGNFDHVIKIPKSDVDKTLGNPLEQAMRFLAHDDPDSIKAIITDTVGSVIPIDTIKDDQFNTSRAVGGVIPPLLKSAVENSSNHSFYNDAQLVPDSKVNLPNDEQINKNTSTLGKITAPILGGGSPIKADNTLRNFSGSLLTEKPQDQLGGKVVGESANKMNTEFYNTLNNTKKERASISNQINQAIQEGDVATAQSLAKRYNAYLAQQFTGFAGTYKGQITQDLRDLYDQQPIVLTPRSIKQRQHNQLVRQAAQ